MSANNCVVELVRIPIWAALYLSASVGPVDHRTFVFILLISFFLPSFLPSFLSFFLSFLFFSFLFFSFFSFLLPPPFFSKNDEPDKFDYSWLLLFVVVNVLL